MQFYFFPSPIASPYTPADCITRRFTAVGHLSRACYNVQCKGGRDKVYSPLPPLILPPIVPCLGSSLFPLVFLSSLPSYPLFLFFCYNIHPSNPPILPSYLFYLSRHPQAASAPDTASSGSNLDSPLPCLCSPRWQQHMRAHDRRLGGGSAAAPLPGFDGSFEAVAHGQTALHAESVCHYLNPLNAGQPVVFVQAEAECLKRH